MKNFRQGGDRAVFDLDRLRRKVLHRLQRTSDDAERKVRLEAGIEFLLTALFSASRESGKTLTMITGLKSP